MTAASPAAMAIIFGFIARSFSACGDRRESPAPPAGNPLYIAPPREPIGVLRNASATMGGQIMRLILLSLPFALLAACGGSGPANKADNAAAPDAANVSAPADAAAPADPLAAAQRANEVNECIADVRPEVPEGTDLNAFCGCAVDRMQSGGGEREAMEACAAQMGIEPRR